MPKIINYPHLANQVFGVPHYATRQTLDAVKTVIIPRMISDSLSLSNDDHLNLQTGVQSERVISFTNPVKVIPLHGILTTRKGVINGACSELVSYERLRSDIAMALDDPNIKEIVLDINSGGGSATGCKELADFIFQSRGVKPITAIVNFYAFSAAYFIAAACSKIILSQTAGVGSIGVIWEHMEASSWEGKNGFKFTTLYRGDFKNVGSVHEPLSEQAQAEINIQLDWMYNLFVTSVAEYRGIDVQKVIDTQARCLYGSDAINSGLADELQHPQDAINSISLAYQESKQNPNIKIRAQAMNQMTQL